MAARVAILFRALEPWAELGPESISRLVEAGDIHEFSNRSTIQTRHENAGDLLMPLTGEVVVRLGASAKRGLVCGVRGPGQPVVEGLGWRRFGPHTAQMVARGRVELHRVPASALDAILEADPRVSDCLLTTVNRRLADLQRQIEEIVTLPVDVRVARFIVREARQIGADHAERKPIPRRYDVDTVAGLLGTVREEVTRAHTRLTRQGLLAFDRRTYVVQDWPALRRLAGL